MSAGPSAISTIWTIARRELGSLFALPLGWVAVALFALISGLVVSWTTLVPGEPASLRTFFAFSGWLLVPVAPAITMRLISEELRSGTIEPLMTTPASDFAVVIGKYAGAVAFLSLMLLPTLSSAGVLWWLAEPKPDAGPIVAGYLCLLLLGMLYLSIGLLASALTNNQTLAFLGTLFALMALLMGPTLGQAYAPEWLRPAVLAAAVHLRVLDFAKGVVDTAHVVFFLTASATLVILACAAYESRRWR